MLDFLSKPVYCSLPFCAKSTLSRLSVVLEKCSHLQCSSQLCHWRAQEGFWKDGGFLGFSLVFVLLLLSCRQVQQYPSSQLLSGVSVMPVRGFLAQTAASHSSSLHSTCVNWLLWFLSASSLLDRYSSTYKRFLRSPASALAGFLLTLKQALPTTTIAWASLGNHISTPDS